MKSKRVKVSFQTVNENNYTPINQDKINKSNKRVKTAMKHVVKTYKNNEVKSKQQAAMLVLNS